MIKSLHPLIPVMLGLVASLPAWSQTPPNIVLIYADDIGYGDLGCYGATAIPTPHVDRLAAEGLRFTSAYATSATCTPSRYSLLTGQYAFRKKGTSILQGDAAAIIRPGRTTLPSILKEMGYHTGVVGKWHLGLGDGNIDWNKEIPTTPLDIGFDYSFIMAATGDRVPCVYVEGRKVVNLDPADPIEVRYDKPFPGMPTGKTHRDSLVMDWSTGHNDAVINGIGRIGFMKGGTAALWNDEDMADDFTGKAVEFIERAHTVEKKPFFLFFATHDNHVPRVPHPRFVGRSTLGPRGDAVVQFDWSVGEVMATLEKLGIAENTLVIISSDNGPVLDDGYKDDANEMNGDHQSNGPWRAGKYSLFEGGTRMPTLLRWPARVKPGVSDAILSQVDWLASFAALVERPLKADEAPDSLDMLAAWLGDSAEGREDVVLHASGLALRSGDWKYIPADSPTDWSFIKKGHTRDNLGPWTMEEIEAPGLLFNLADDPGERNNLAANHPEKLQELDQRLRDLIKAGRSRAVD